MDKNKSTGLEALALCSQLGLTMAIPIVLGIIGGNWLDKRLGTGMVFLAILLVIGILAGFIGAYQQIMATTKNKKP